MWWCQVGRPVTRADFNKILHKVAGIKLSPLAVDLLFALFGDANGELDSVALVEVMQRRDKLPGKRVRQRRGAGGGSRAGGSCWPAQPLLLLAWWTC
jgi:hypothetical protein